MVALAAVTTAALLLGWSLLKSFLKSLRPMGPREFAALVQASANPEELRSWALGSSTQNPDGEPPLATMPKSLRAAGAKGGGIGPMIYRITKTNGEPAYVRVFWGYSFGNGYEVDIGPTNLAFRSEGRLIPWVPGICFSDPSQWIQSSTVPSK